METSLSPTPEGSYEIYVVKLVHSAGVSQSNVHDHQLDSRKRDEVFGLTREMDIYIHGRSILLGENYHWCCEELDFQNLRIGSSVNAGWRGSLVERTVASEGKEVCSECECKLDTITVSPSEAGHHVSSASELSIFFGCRRAVSVLRRKTYHSVCLNGE